MKILILSDSLNEGGRERRMIELIKGLLKLPDVGMELVLFSSRIDYPEIHHIGIPLKIIERKPKKDPRVFGRFYKLCKNFKPDVIHAWSSMCAIFALPAAKLLNVKLINGNIADAPKGLKLWGKQLLRAKLTFPFSDVIVSNSEAGIRAYNAPTSKCLCIHNGFDFNRISALDDPIEVRKRFGIKTRFVVGMVSSFTFRKDYPTYIQSAIQICRQRNDVSFLAVGKGPALEACKAMVPDSFKERIIFTGSQNRVESIINVFDIGVLCTNLDTHGEGISNAIMECMALSKPVIATGGGGTNEIVADRETGFLIPQKEPEVLTEKINFLLNYRGVAEKMGASGQQRINDYFHLDKMTQNYYQLYQKMISLGRF